MFGKHQNYPDRGSLEQVRVVLKEAAAVFDEKFRVRWKLYVPPVGGGIAGAAAGVAVGKGALVVGAAAGLKGAAALTSGLAVAGAVVGGGMAAGIAVVAVPAVVLGGVGYAILKRKQKNLLKAEKEELLTESLTRHEAIRKKRSDWRGDDPRLLNHLQEIEVRLGDVIRNLKQDLDHKRA